MWSLFTRLVTCLRRGRRITYLIRYEDASYFCCGFLSSVFAARQLHLSPPVRVGNVQWIIVVLRPRPPPPTLLLLLSPRGRRSRMKARTVIRDREYNDDGAYASVACDNNDYMD